MSIDRSLRLKDALIRHRNVLTRAERIDQLKDEERWEEETSVLGLPKVAHRKSHAGKKAEKKEATAEGATGVEGTAAAPAGAGTATGAGKTAAPGKTPAAGTAKAAAPAAQKPGKEAKKGK
ncbi:MAG: small basic protein [Sedimentisphaerales bacterium]|jgi:small basic protein (TIGR04137 family)